MEAKNRYELYQRFNEVMNSVYVSRKNKQKQNYNQNMVKTYLLEGHINNKAIPSHDDFLILFNEEKYNNRYEMELIETEDEYLFKLIFNDVEFFLDAEVDKRFLLLHTSEKTEITDKELHHLINAIPKFDNIWLTKKLMELTNKYAFWRGISLSHDEIALKETDYETENINLKINNSSESKIKNLIDLLNNNKDFFYSTGISGLSLMLQENKNERVLDDLRYDGKFSTRGDSFNRHLWLVNKIYDEYKKLISNIENNYMIKFNKGNLQGLPINIEFQRKDLKVDYIINAIFSHKKPFKLWGFPQKINNDYYKVYAIDLHNGNQGNKINFEVSNNFISVYLPAGNCGNTVARLVCNIQQHIDANVSVWGGNNDELF